MPVGLEAWLIDIPPITRTWLIAAIGTSLAVQCHVITPLQLYFSFKSAFINLQPWRSITTFLYFGPLSIDFVFHLFFFMRYSRMLEESSFAGRKADYFWLLFTSASLLLALSPLFTLPFLSSPLAFTLVYIWSRRQPAMRISLFGILTVSAPYLPIALVAISWVINGTWRAAASDLMGCVVGHAWYVGTDVMTREVGGQMSWTKTPPLVQRWFSDPAR